MNKLLNLKKIIDILDSQQRRLFFLLFILYVILAFVEALSIGVILPLIYLLVDQKSEMYIFIQNIYGIFLSNITHKDLIIISLIIVVFVYLIKALFFAFITKLSLKTTAQININLTNKLYKSYLNENYLFHLNQNTSKLLRNILTEVNHFCNLIFLIIQMISDILIVIFITLMLLFVEPLIISVILATLFVISFSYYMLITKRIYKLGKIRQENDFYIIKNINESFSLIKEIIIYNLQKIFVDKHKDNYSKSIFADANHNFLSTMVRPLLETVSIILFVALLVSIVLIDQNFSFEEYIPFIAFLSASTFKLLPAINNITSRLGHIKFILPSLDAVYSNLNFMNDTNSSKIIDEKEITFNNIIKVNNLNYVYKEKNIKTLDNLNFEIKKYDFFAITGSSGVGKTTLLNILMGLLEPSKGQITCDGFNIQKSIKKWQNIISFVPQNIVLFDGTIKENIILGIDYNKEKYDDVIEKTMLKDFIKSLPEKENTLVGERGFKVSGGERQRIAIARALYREPKLIFLDEATNSLDSKTEDELIESILKLKNYMTFVIIAHNNKIKEICNKKLELGNQ